MAPGRQGFGGDQLLERLAQLPEPRRYRVGFSGGADSTALLQALYEVRDRLPAEIHAIHFHHGLHADADAWAEHCRSFCEQRGIPFCSRSLEVDKAPRVSLEEAARDARYLAVAELLQPGEMYLTAHHAEDQAETLFLNLMRGSGIEGLAGIPALRNLAGGWVARPLLDVESADLRAFLRSRDIRWLEDPSNRDTSFDRNFLRQELFPLLEERWPGVSRRLARSARHARESARAMATFIERRCGALLQDPIKMPADRLARLEPEMQALILRQWLRRNEIPSLPTARLQEFLQQLAAARSSSQAEVCWAGWMIRRYRNTLWLHRSLPALACRTAQWQNEGRVELGPAVGLLTLSDPKTRPPAGWTVAPRRPGARIRKTASEPSRTLKHCFQSCGIPPWLRAGVPVLYWDAEPVALGDWLVAERLRRWLAGNAVELTWHPAASVLGRVREDCQKTRL